ncbi:MAG: hypothetical protein AMXMBFR4_01320 [Candidatus Hydrogenedentota bacterium]
MSSGPAKSRDVSGSSVFVIAPEFVLISSAISGAARSLPFGLPWSIRPTWKSNADFRQLRVPLSIGIG